MVNGIISLISLYDISLLIYRNAQILCINSVSCHITKFVNELLKFSGSIFRVFYV